MYVKKELKTLFCVRSVVTSFDTVHQEGFYFAGEMHDFWEAVYIADGNANATADDRVYTLHRGDLLFHKPMEYHRIWAEDGSHRVVIISFSADGEGMSFFRGKLFHLDSDGEALMLAAAQAAAKVISEYSETERKNSYVIASQKAKTAIESLLVSLYGEESDGADVSGGEFGHIVNVMRECLAQNLTVSGLARKCNMSASTLKKRFAAYSDKGVIKYYTGMKIRRAIDMLASGDTIKETSYALGFSSINYFHTVFRRETGMTPGQYIHKNL